MFRRSSSGGGRKYGQWNKTSHVALALISAWEQVILSSVVGIVIVIYVALASNFQWSMSQPKLDVEPRLLTCYVDYPDPPSSPSEHDLPWSRKYKECHRRQHVVFTGVAGKTPCVLDLSSSSDSEESKARPSSVGLELSPPQVGLEAKPAKPWAAPFFARAQEALRVSSPSTHAKTWPDQGSF